ncbi:MAG: VOC family protein [Allosphingosinicella sp.]|uniref:VOC family protein n=1 Tax=Allosphingosinicella sp. TaxID=2823234 RepID=UPI00395746E1
MAVSRIEHVNLTVRAPERSAKLMVSIFGWSVRWQGPAMNGGRTIHVGSEAQYLAFYTAPDRTYDDEDFRKGHPLNHVAVEVDDLDDVEAKVVAAGLTPFSHGDYEPGRRFYFLDPDGIEFEVVSYSRR